MITYLDYPECWKGAARFYHADTLTHWRKRKQMGHNIAAVDEASTKQLADLIRNHFHCTEGRGNHCIVEPLRRGSLDYFFAYPEDYSQQSVEWMEGQLQPKSHNPAFEIVFIYSQKDGTLDLHIHGSYQAVKPLQEMFVIAILKLEKLPPESKDSRAYDLNSLRYRMFGFTYSVGSGIENVAVKKLRLSSRINPGERLILENDVTQDSMGSPLWKPEDNTVRPRFLSRLQSFVDVASKHEILPHLREMAKDMLTTVKKQWPDVKYLEFYPAWSQKKSE